MNFQQKNIYASLFTVLILFGAYYWKVSDLYAAGAFDGPDGTRLIGKAILTLMVAGIMLRIIGMILIGIFHAILTNTPKPSFLIDERDREIEMQALKVGNNFTFFGMVSAFIALAMGWSIFAVFQIIIGACAVSSLAEVATQFILYRRAA